MNNGGYNPSLKNARYYKRTYQLQRKTSQHLRSHRNWKRHQWRLGSKRIVWERDKNIGAGEREGCTAHQGLPYSKSIKMGIATQGKNNTRDIQGKPTHQQGRWLR